MVIGIGLLAVDAVIPLHIGVSAKLVIGVAGEPFAEDAGVHALQGFGDGADAVVHQCLLIGIGGRIAVRMVVSLSGQGAPGTFLQTIA